MKAFPSAYDPQTGSAEKGMTLRDYFAAKAMQALHGIASIEKYHPETISEMAYEMADAMLKARDA